MSQEYINDIYRKIEELERDVRRLEEEVRNLPHWGPQPDLPLVFEE